MAISFDLFFFSPHHSGKAKIFHGRQGGIFWWVGLKEAPITVGVATYFVAFILTSNLESP